MGWLRKEVRDLKRADPTASSSSLVAEQAAAAASMVSTELRLPLRWASRQSPSGGGGTAAAAAAHSEGSVLSSIRLLEDLEKSSAIRLPHSAKPTNLFSILLQHGLDLCTTAADDGEAATGSSSADRWAQVEPRLSYLLRISPATASSVETVVKKLAALFVDKIVSVEWSGHDRDGKAHQRAEQKKRPVRDLSCFLVPMTRRCSRLVRHFRTREQLRLTRLLRFDALSGGCGRGVDDIDDAARKARLTRTGAVDGPTHAVLRCARVHNAALADRRQSADDSVWRQERNEHAIR